MATAYIKCPFCGKKEKAHPSDYDGKFLQYICSSCHKQFQVEFFDHCPRCHQNIGFIDGGNFSGDMLSAGKMMLKTAVTGSLFSAIASLGSVAYKSFTGEKKDSNGDGKCPVCGQRYVRCPKCNSMVQIPSKTIWSDEITCPSCSQLIAPCTAVRDGCGHKHSNNFFKQ